MKLIECTINVERGIVFVRCWLNVQGIDHPITFMLKETDLYTAAEARGNSSWDTEDLLSVAHDQLGLDIVV